MNAVMPNGVKARMDGAGDEWARQHRLLGPTFNMHDIDALFGFMAFGQNTGEKLFIEYVPDNYKNRTSMIRNFAAVAMFDRKSTEDAAFHERNTLSAAYYLWLCRTISMAQPIPVRFFYVIGKQEPPWKMIELDINTGEKTGVTADIQNARDFRPLWDAIGLSDLRTEMKKHIDP